MGYAAGALAVSGHKALHAMRRRCAELGISSPDLQLTLFDSLVHPGLSYGAEIWATQYLLGGDNPCENLHRAFMRRTLGVRAGTPNQVVLAELGRYALAVHWGKLTARFWSRLACMEDGRLAKQAFMLSLQLANRVPASMPAAYHPWAAQAANMLSMLGFTSDLNAPTLICADTVAKKMQDHQVRQLVACDKPKVQHYVANVCGGVTAESYGKQEYVTAVTARSRMVRLAQLRTG